MNDFSVDLSSGSFFVNPVGMSSFEDVLIKDHKSDTLIFVNLLKVESHHFGGLFNNNIYLNEVIVDSLLLNHIKYEGESVSNLDLFFEKLRSDHSPERQFLAKRIQLKGATLQFIDKNDEDNTQFHIDDLYAKLSEVDLQGETFSATMNEMTCYNKEYDMDIIRSFAELSIDSRGAKLENFQLSTPNSKLAADVNMRFPENNGEYPLKDVFIDALVADSFIGVDDIHSFLPSISGPQSFSIDRLHFSGTPQKFVVDSLRLSSSTSFFSGSFSIDQSDLTSKLTVKESMIHPEDMISFFPALSQQQMDFLQHIGPSKMTAELTRMGSDQNLNMSVMTPFGRLGIDFDFRSKGNQFFSFYDGQIQSNQFDIGGLLQQKNLGTSNFSFYARGKGFGLNQLDSEIRGHLSSFSYQSIKLDSIIVSLDAKNKQIVGQIRVDDPEAKLHLSGELNTSDSQPQIVATVNVDELKLKSIFPSTFKKNRHLSGNFEIVGLANDLNELIGDLNADTVHIQGDDEKFVFETFTIQSRVNKDLRFFNIRSNDGINGLVYGRFEFSDVQSMLSNSIGNSFANYKPIDVDPSKFVNFNLNLKEKFTRAFFDKIAIADDSFLRGKISALPQETFLRVDIPRMNYQKNTFSEIQLTIDNSNPFYTSYLQIKDVKGSEFDLNQFRLISTMLDDKLHFRVEYEDNALKSQLNT